MTIAAAATPIFHPNLPLSVIVESVHNPRKRFDETSLKELAATIEARGIHNPVLVREIETPGGSRFELAAGHRRCRAARMVGLVEVPALIMQLDDDAFVELLHLDNLQRDDIDPLDEALGYEQLLERGYELQTIAEKIRKSITYVASRVRLLSLGTAAREAMRLGYVKVSHAIELAKLPEGVQEQLLEDQWNLSPAALLRSAGVPIGDPVGADNAEDEADDVEAEDADDEDPEYFEAPAADKRFRNVQWDTIREPTLQDLKRAMALEVFRKLSAVPWDLADETLIPEAGACTRCPKRSSMEPLLFAELDSGHDACLDASCFESKRDVFHDLQRGIRRAVERPAEETTHDESTADPYAEQRDAATRTNEQQQKAQAQRKEQLRLKQIGRTAVVREVLVGMPKNALSLMPVLRVLVLALLDRLTQPALGQLLEIMNLDTTAPAGWNSWDYGWMEDRIAAWVNEEGRTAKDLTRGLLLAAIGPETAIMGTSVDDECRTLQQLAAIADVDVAAVADEAIAAEKAEAKKARRRKPEAVPA